SILIPGGPAPSAVAIATADGTKESRRVLAFIVSAHCRASSADRAGRALRRGQGGPGRVATSRPGAERPDLLPAMHLPCLADAGQVHGGGVLVDAEHSDARVRVQNRAGEQVGRPSSNMPSTVAITGRYSPLPTRASGPGL